MNEALIGQTGFVGKNLLDQRTFYAKFSSNNIETIRGREFDRVICAGASAVKWWANNNPDEDLAKIQNLISHISRVRCKKFILISTIDVYAQPTGVDETNPPIIENLHAYGRNRLFLESFVNSQFENCSIVRLPGLFGNYLKKNAIFDLLTRNQTDLINSAATYQWYPISRLAADLDIIERNKLALVHLACEPLVTADLCSRYFPDVRIGEPAHPAPVYDFRTVYANLFGEVGPYMLREPAISDALEKFILAARRGGLLNEARR